MPWPTAIGLGGSASRTRVPCPRLPGDPSVLGRWCSPTSPRDASLSLSPLSVPCAPYPVSCAPFPASPVSCFPPPRALCPVSCALFLVRLRLPPSSTSQHERLPRAGPADASLSPSPAALTCMPSTSDPVFCATVACELLASVVRGTALPAYISSPCASCRWGFSSAPASSGHARSLSGPLADWSRSPSEGQRADLRLQGWPALAHAAPHAHRGWRFMRRHGEAVDHSSFGAPVRVIHRGRAPGATSAHAPRRRPTGLSCNASHGETAQGH